MHTNNTRESVTPFQFTGEAGQRSCASTSIQISYDNSLLKCFSEYGAYHAGRLGRPQAPAQGRKRPISLPLLQSGSPERPIHVLLRLVRRRMEDSERSRLPARESTQSRSRYLLPVRRGLSGRVAAFEKAARRGSS